MDRNLVVGSVSIPFAALKDDMEPSGLWGGENMLNFFRHNIVSDSPQGIRFKAGGRIENSLPARRG